MSDATLVNKAMEMTFTCDVTTAGLLRDLVVALELPADNLAVRWAICRSLSEGPIGRLIAHDGGGKELKGRTLFGNNELASLLLSQMLVVEGADTVSSNLRGVVLSHWSRGQKLLHEDLVRFGGNAEAVVVADVDRRTLTTGAPDYGGQIIGQQKLVRQLEQLHAKAWHKRPVALDAPAIVVGLPGTGRSFVAGVLARSLSDVVVEIEGYRDSSVATLQDQIPDLPEHANVMLVENYDLIPRRTREGLRRRIPASTSLVGTATTADALDAGTIVLSIEPYDRDAVAQILRRHHGWHLEVRRMVALAGRLRPAYAMRQAELLVDLVDGPTVTDRDAMAALEAWGLDRLGLTDRDRRAISAMDRTKPITETDLALAAEIDPQELSEVVLPYLEQLGLAVHCGRQRWALTTVGVETYGS
jgi:DNA sulfur modification protein DndE